MDTLPQLQHGVEAQAAVRSENAQEKTRQQAENQENAVNSLLSQILDQQALVRLSNLSAVKPEKAKMVERGQIVGKLSDDALKQLMERVATQTTRTTTVKASFTIVIVLLEPFSRFRVDQIWFFTYMERMGNYQPRV
ncbi:unnamed protein product [Strongylus vulgaris]|uniref:Uncharacterized protein n=1 Tax=Strongylus vulgaris TaxID=40348 RepID=A0A3P7K969_STRVU|nr:unnamed protein product [Strongylus vulgaris]